MEEVRKIVGDKFELRGLYFERVPGAHPRWVANRRGWHYGIEERMYRHQLCYVASAVSEGVLISGRPSPDYISAFESLQGQARDIAVHVGGLV